MMRLYQNLGIAAALMIVSLCTPAAHAQQEPSQQTPQDQPQQSAPPIPAYRSPLASAADNGDADGTVDPQKIIPDDHSLTGAENLGLGVPSLTHSYWQPHVDLVSSLDSNPVVSPGQSGWSTWTSVLAGVDLRRTSGNTDLTVTYLGGGMLSNTGNASNGIIQAADIKDKISFKRTTVTIIDQLNYTPGSTSGFAGLGSVQLPGAGLNGLGSGFTPGQTILTTLGQTLNNSFVTEVDTNVTHRTSISVIGGYSLLHYFDGSLLDFGNANAQVGYNYQLNRSDTIAISYQFSAIRYSNFDQSINNNTVFVSYGHRVTGRMAFQVAVGPDFAFLRSPINPASTTSGQGGTGSSGTGGTSTGTNSIQQIFWSMNAGLHYQLQRATLGATYAHGVGGGSGVLAGSVYDSVSGSMSSQFSRTTSGGVNFGYSHNKGLGVDGSTPVSETFGYWFGGANVSRPWGRELNLALSYQLQYQNSNSSFCIGTTCGSSVLRNVISFTVGWRGRPIGIE
jgi:hypothetical protein